MKLKHWQGYGTVNARKYRFEETDTEKILTIEVSGDHECGIIRNDKYDVYNWLVKRFDKTVDSYRKIKSLKITEFTPDKVYYKITIMK